MSNSTSGSTRERPTCSSTSSKAALPFVYGLGSPCDTDLSLSALSGKSNDCLRKPTATQSHFEHISRLVRAAHPPHAHRGAVFPIIGLLQHAYDFGPASITPCRFAWRRLPVLVVNNEFFIVPRSNPVRQRWQQLHPEPLPGGSAAVPSPDSFSVRPYYMVQSVNLPSGWDTNQIAGISLALKVTRKTK